MSVIPGNFHRWHQNKATPMHEGMGQAEILRPQNHLFVQQQVHINGSDQTSAYPTLTPETDFQLHTERPQLLSTKLRLHKHHSIEVGWDRIWCFPRLSFIDTGTGDKLYRFSLKCCNDTAEQLIPLTEIASQSYQSQRHRNYFDIGFSSPASALDASKIERSADCSISMYSTAYLSGT